jgi:steroid delta-isomerase-like uncharacterized protein
MTTTDTTRDLLHRYYSEVWVRGNVAALDDLLDDDYVDHDPTPGFGTDKASAKGLVAAITGGMQNAALDSLDMIVEGDHAAAHWTMHWTQQGAFMGLPADGKEIHLRGHDFYRLRAGKIADIWHCEDFAGLLGQLGALPPLG